ncbi:MAG: hypothetical protein ACLFUB_18500 [Cyclobacteriaceae bacterium]
MLKRSTNINGAPFKIGDHVIVLNNPNDVTFDHSFEGKDGVVQYFEYNCNCGQSFPSDPMIGVQFRNEVIEEFWKEELQLL